MDIDGNENDEKLDGTTTADEIRGEGGDDTLTGFAGDDVLLGGKGDDHLDGGTGNDDLNGGDGNDTIVDDAKGNDTLTGFLGDDIITVARTRDANTDVIEISGGRGADTITYTGNALNRTTVNIDAGKDANTINVDFAGTLSVFSGRHVDTVDLSVNDYGRVHSGGSADVVTAAVSAEASVGLSLGRGADQVTLNMENSAHYRLNLRDGAAAVGTGETDTVVLGGGGGEFSKVLIKNFDAGEGGDLLKIGAFLDAYTDWDGTGNAAAEGYLNTKQVGDDLLVRVDVDGSAGPGGWQVLFVLQGVNEADFVTAENIDFSIPAADSFAI